MIVIYNILLYCYFVISFPFYLVKFFTSERYRCGLKERLGFVERMSNRRRILVHTVSVGEFLGALPFINALRNKYPQFEIIVSTTTVTGNRVAKAKVGSNIKVVFFPLDFSFSVKKFFNRISPDLVILVETELWPNFLVISRKKNVPVVVVNGRISGHSYRKYSMLRGFFGDICGGIEIWGVQFERDKDRLIKLGILPQKVHVTGSIKFDSAVQQISYVSETKDVLVLVGGSTHNGEEKILLDIYKDIKDNFKKLVLILVPRHPERTESIKKLIEGYGLGYILKSTWKAGAELTNYEVLLVDTIGELISIYSLATVVFIGKSLVKGGGQNLIEPAGLGKPVICGPLMENFLDITQWLVENGGVIQVRDVSELKQAIVHLLSNPSECVKLGNRARELVLKATGAVKRNMELIGKAI